MVTLEHLVTKEVCPYCAGCGYKLDLPALRRLISHRQESDLLFTQAFIAEKLSKSPQYLSDILKGRRRLSPNIVERIVELLNHG